MKKIMFYCQHVLGMGHLVRSLEIVRALNEYEVYFLNGGELLPELTIPPAIHVINLPPIKSDSEFEGIQSVDSTLPLEEIKKARLNLILLEFDRIQPEVLILELFPFGRKRFAFELVPLLARIRLLGGKTKVVCSLRDILVSKSDQARHEEWVVALINRYFDLFLVHSDPTFQSLDETFSQSQALACDMQYTGFVAQEAPLPQTEPLEHIPKDPEGTPLIVVSIGGGRVGYELVECAIKASGQLTSSLPHRMVIFTGPYMSEKEYSTLQQLVRGKPYIALKRYTNQFLSYLNSADLSISMAGYNTCMNIVSTGVRALVLPFMGRGNQEQLIRTRKLEEHGKVIGLDPHKLDSDYLMKTIEETFRTPLCFNGSPIDIQGAKKTSVLINELVNSEKPTSHFSGRSPEPRSSAARICPAWKRELQEGLESLSDTQKIIPIFLRDDDIDEDEESLRHLLDIALSRNAPMNLQIIPEKLTKAGVRVLKDFNRVNPELVSLNQHGWTHLNHEKAGKKCEFGPSRNFQEQLEDISKGKAILESIFPIRFFPVFTPPWNRCTPDTFKVLDELGFHLLSKDLGKQPITGYSFTEISTSLDLYAWKSGAKMKAPEDIVKLLLRQMNELSVIGILLHHKVMDATAFAFLDQLLGELQQWPNVEFHTFQTLMQTEKYVLPVQKS
jgi:predicted glycosyltransferase